MQNSSHFLFAFSNPNGRPEAPESVVGSFEWLPVSSEFPTRYLSIALEPEMRENFQEGRPRFWVENVPPNPK